VFDNEKTNCKIFLYLEKSRLGFLEEHIVLDKEQGGLPMADEILLRFKLRMSLHERMLCIFGAVSMCEVIFFSVFVQVLLIYVLLTLVWIIVSTWSDLLVLVQLGCCRAFIALPCFINHTRDI
jgi:hypothetical protein